MPELPSGTVTFLFTDIEGSTRLLQECGDRWPRLLARHAELLRRAFRDNGGIELGTEGDSFFAVFESAPGAVVAAIDAQRALADEPWPTATPIRVRIGIHTGEGVLGGDNYVGIDVHRAARIMSAGHGAQVLVSGATEPLVRGSLPGQIELLDLGEHRLRDLPAPERIFMAFAPGLEREFPPPRGVAVPVVNLPVSMTSFIGRDEEAERVRALLAENRVVTLTGPGGTGKTRLSLHVAQAVRDDYPGGVFFVPLADIRELELVLPTIGQVVGLVDPGRRPLERIPEHLADRRVLLVLDNLEQIIEVAPDIAELVRRAPDVAILATSRSPMRIYGEAEFGVPPLRLPDPREVPPDASIVQYPAVALFVERARAVRPDFTVTDANAAAVAEICWRLDGLPLALELAAARIRILTPQAMAARIGHRLDIGVGGGRDRPERQQTLRGAIAWSHELLDDEGRQFFARLSVFRGGADLDAIEAIVTDDGRDPLEAVASLVDESLVRQEELADGSVRFGMLETIREYADEQLSARDDADLMRRRHAEYYLSLIERLAQRVFDADSRSVLDAIEQEHDNVRAAVQWCQDRDEAEMALRFLTACWRFWQIRGHLPEAAERARRTLALPGVEAHPDLLAMAQEAAGGVFYWQGNFPNARAHYEQALALRRTLGDEAQIANALYNVSMTYIIDFESARARVNPAARELIGEALDIYRRIGDRHGEGRALWAATDAEILDRNHEKAREMGRECLAIFEEVGDRFMEAWTHYMLGTSENIAGEARAAAGHMRRALAYFEEADDLSGFALVFDGYAASAYRQGQTELAMRLAGAANAIQHAGGTELGKLNREWSDFHPEALLSDPDLAAAYGEGARMDRRQVSSLARTVSGD